MNKKTREFGLLIAFSDVTWPSEVRIEFGPFSKVGFISPDEMNDRSVQDSIVGECFMFFEYLEIEKKLL